MVINPQVQSAEIKAGVSHFRPGNWKMMLKILSKLKYLPRVLFKASYSPKSCILKLCNDKNKCFVKTDVMILKTKS